MMDYMDALRYHLCTAPVRGTSKACAGKPVMYANNRNMYRCLACYRRDVEHGSDVSYFVLIKPNLSSMM